MPADYANDPVHDYLVELAVVVRRHLAHSIVCFPSQHRQVAGVEMGQHAHPLGYHVGSPPTKDRRREHGPGRKRQSGGQERGQARR